MKLCTSAICTRLLASYDEWNGAIVNDKNVLNINGGNKEVTRIICIPVVRVFVDELFENIATNQRIQWFDKNQ